MAQLCAAFLLASGKLPVIYHTTIGHENEPTVERRIDRMMQFVRYTIATLALRPWQIGSSTFPLRACS